MERTEESGDKGNSRESSKENLRKKFDRLGRMCYNSINPQIMGYGREGGNFTRDSGSLIFLVELK